MMPTSAPALITIVIATYNRPDVLEFTVRSVLQQTEQRWKLLVIGDQCAAETQSLLESFIDPRIHYINLPSRCGEQAGPNSVGMLLADTPYVALLNHDDLWLPDHLHMTLAELERSGADLCVARAAIAHAQAVDDKDAIPARFVEASPLQRTMSQAFNTNPALFEPCSAWVMRRELIRRVGPWRSGRKLHRTTLQDWMMRAWRASARLCSPLPITVLKFNTHHPDRTASSRRPAYSWGNREQRTVFEKLSLCSPDDFRRVIAEELEQGNTEGQSERDLLRLVRRPPNRLAAWACTLLLSQPAAWIYRLSGLDGFNLYAQRWGKPRGSLLEGLSRARLGQPMPLPYELDVLLAFASQELQRNA